MWSDSKRAQAQLARLETLLKEHLATLRTELPQRLSREQIAGSEFLTLKLDGSLIPWDEAPVADLSEEHKKQLDKLAEVLKTKTLTVSLGIRDGYLLLSVGDTSAQLLKQSWTPPSSNRRFPVKFPPKLRLGKTPDEISLGIDR